MKTIILIILSFITLNAQVTRIIPFSSNPAPSAATYDADAQAYFNVAGGGLSTTRKDTINTFIEMLKDSLGIANLSQKFVRFGLLANDDTLSALTSIVYPDSAATITISSMAFEVDRGFTGDGSEDYLNTRFIPSQSGLSVFEKDSCSLGLYIRTNVSENKWDMMGYDGTVWTALISFNDPNTTISLNSSYHTTDRGITNPQGLICVVRTDENTGITYQNGALKHTYESFTSVQLTSASVYIGGGNNNGTLQSPATKQYAAYFFGDKFSATEVRKINNCVEWYLDAIGAGVE